ncbi:uncharacterized protein B0I36DRAFT_156597 [Microdochium trichocladiopsis]|uniref:Uncharacterized protein n=1 Tax=Microdochium trichocladiopsis TaxID=1682393 RepID=A0A9P9BQW8_9PEZI|nr:uncharacterized protein B0I36DRAFT_156597 [Microdochium trichocladiopsis]KAH7026307.1 hypothetical protein B0I36DRAFT_156597 [Microdochium trichocladiopsis]
MTRYGSDWLSKTQRQDHEIPDHERIMLGRAACVSHHGRSRKAEFLQLHSTHTISATTCLLHSDSGVSALHLQDQALQAASFWHLDSIAPWHTSLFRIVAFFMFTSWVGATSLGMDIYTRRSRGILQSFSGACNGYRISVSLSFFCCCFPLHFSLSAAFVSSSQFSTSLFSRSLFCAL